MMMFDKVVSCSQTPPTASKGKGLVKAYTSTCAMKLHIHIHVNTCILGLGNKFCAVRQYFAIVTILADSNTIIAYM